MNAKNTIPAPPMTPPHPCLKSSDVRRVEIVRDQQRSVVRRIDELPSQPDDDDHDRHFHRHDDRVHRRRF